MTGPANLQVKLLSVDTYDAAANYFWGLSSEKTGNDSDALDGFSVATLSPNSGRLPG